LASSVGLLAAIGIDVATCLATIGSVRLIRRLRRQTRIDPGRP
jgi:hypothetical protein